ncbi:Fis family transcriptional regulator [Kiloniella spongiae]|uniref:Fis family transcriptional regulator n=1 Tax=Kiloniella spongiae TaxID=1489064 RepID=A0A0H2MCT0_9PROT|nr:helix-turn-helix domain-containing protein [Kiloniella spongiae]KLN60379.1 Fis family transcriptional regulator [Kiloniella spongiae]
MGSTSNHAAHVENTLEANGAAQTAVAASWRRSKLLHHLSPDYTRPPERISEHELKQAREKLGSLIHTAETSLDRLYLAVGNAGCCVVLADASGIAVDRRGAVSDDKTYDDWGLSTGSLWSEESEGTNGIGTCIVEKRPLTIHKNQHFHSKNTNLSCSAAPIFDHEGHLLAAIDVSSSRADLTPDFAKIISFSVIDTARQIESEYFRQTYHNADIVLATPPSSQQETSTSLQTALLAVDQDGIVIGASRGARRLYGLPNGPINEPILLADLRGRNVNHAKEYELAERRVILQALAHTGGNISAAAHAMGISRATLHRKIKFLGLAV